MAISSGVSPHAAWLSVNGMMIPVLSGSVEQAATRKSGTFSAEVALNYPGAMAALAALGDNEASIIVQSKGQILPLIVGEIDSTDFKFIDGTISISGRDKSAKLHEKKSSEKWVNKKTGEIVQDLASRVGLSADVDPGLLKAGKYVNIDYARVTDGISYAAVIHKLAEQDGARWFCTKQGSLKYQYQNSPSGTYTLNYNPGPPISADFFSLSVKRNIQAGKTQKVTVKSWHPKQKKVNQHVATITGVGGPVEFLYHLPNLMQERVQQHAKSKAKEHARHELTLSAHLVGDVSIDIAMDLMLMGTVYFDGAYKMDSISHKFGYDGYTMDISAKTAKSGRSES